MRVLIDCCDRARFKIFPGTAESLYRFLSLWRILKTSDEGTTSAAKTSSGLSLVHFSYLKVITREELHDHQGEGY